MSELAVGQRIQLSDGRTGVIRYVGQTAFAPGDWVGIELDDGSGKNDGSVHGERYFDCPMGYGMFVRPTTVTVLAQPPPPPPPSQGPSSRPAARKPARPSSLMSARASAPAEPGLARRMSLNAPSPSPVPRQSRSSSTIRVCSPPPPPSLPPSLSPSRPQFF